jgi:uncharacterized protein
MLKRILAGLIVGVVMASVAVAGPLEDGTTAAHRGDYATAMKLWRPLAEQGDATAEASLAALYENGDGVPRDYAEAVKWYRLAADQGHSSAQNNLGGAFANGEGVPQDLLQAYRWFAIAVAQGQKNAAKNRDAVAGAHDW